MRKFTLLFLTFFSVISLSRAQNMPVHEGSGKVAFIEAVTAAGLSKDEVYNALKAWGDSQEGFTLVEEDAAGGKIVYKGKLTVFYNSPVGGSAQNGDVNFNFSLFAKDGKYRYVATDFVHTGNGKAPDAGPFENESPACGKGKMIASSWSKVKNTTKNEMEEAAISLKKKMKATQNDPTKEDW